MATTTAAQVLDALHDAGIKVNAATRTAVAEACGSSARQLSAAELGEFVQLFKSKAVGNSAGCAQPGPVQFVANAGGGPESRKIIADLLAAGFGAGGITSADLERLTLDRLRDLHRNHTFQGYSHNAAAGGDAAGELARLATAVRTAIQGASAAALAHLGTAKLQQLRDDLAAAVVATSASTSAVNGAAHVGGEFDGYSLNALHEA